ncbi:hypothetical protein NMG60_11004930 [Bertholletia excelsa]
MARRKVKSLVTCFTREGDCFGILCSNGVVKIWNTNSGSPLAETRVSDANSDVIFSCMACCFVGKKRRKDRGTCLLALGTDGGDIFVVDVFTGERKWKASRYHAGGIAGLSFTNRGRILHTVGNDGMASEIYSETGEVVRDFKVSKVPLSSVACYDEKVLAVASAKIRIFSWENGKELLKFSIDGGPVQHMSISEEAKAIVTSRSSEKHIQVWKCQLSTRVVSKGPVLQMKHPPFALECMNGATGEDSLVILSISESGIVYIWNLKTVSESDEEIKATKVTVKAGEGDMGLQNTGSVRKSCMLIMAARLRALESDGRVTALIAYGSPESPQFSILDISNPVEDIVITAGDGTNKTSRDLVKENGVSAEKEDLEAISVPAKNGKGSKKRPAPETCVTDTENLVDNGHKEAIDGSQIDEDLNEPTLGEKLASLDILEKEEVKSLEQRGSSQHATPPSADSVHVLLKQALHADDRTLLINCLYTQDEKVVTKSVSLLNPSDVLKLLDSLISIIQSRGAVLVCALPWLRSLLLEHASRIMSQESSVTVLNSLYQLIEARVANFQPALQLSSCLDLFYTGTIDDGLDEIETTIPVIYEDKDDSEDDGEEEEESADAMETDEEGSDLEPFQDVGDPGGSDDIGYD